MLTWQGIGEEVMGPAGSVESAGLNYDLPQVWDVLSSYKEGTFKDFETE